MAFPSLSSVSQTGLRVGYWLSTRLTNRPDDEHKAHRSRFAIPVLASIGLIIAHQSGIEGAQTLFDQLWLHGLVYFLITLALFGHLLAYPSESPARRIISIALDLWILSAGTYALGDDGATLYPLYLWLVFSCGFRYGSHYLIGATVFALSALGILFYVNGYWLDYPFIALAKLGGIVLLAGYVSSFVSAFNRALEGEKAASQAKSLFLASISHEVRTPLNAIKGLSDLLGDSKLDAEQRRMVHTISQSGTSLLGLINQLLDFSRAESGKMPQKIEDFDLFSLLGRVHRLLNVQAVAKDLRFTIHLHPDVHQTYHGNQRFLEDVLVNLVSNSIKFTEDGHVSLDISVHRDFGGRHFVDFKVKDTGIGIATEAQGRIFESFSQSDASILDRFGGSGLGLALCRQYVQQMSGIIWVDSELEKGSTFSFRVPLDLGPAAGSVASGDLPVFLISDQPVLQDYFTQLHQTGEIYQSLSQMYHNRTFGADGEPLPLIFAERRCCDIEPEEVQRSLRASGLEKCPQVVWICPNEQDAKAMREDDPAHALGYLSYSSFPQDQAKMLALATALYDSSADAFSYDLPQGQQGLLILVADDNKTNQMLMEALLTRMGHQVVLVEDGKEALSSLREGFFDLALIDINMPCLNGLEVTAHYREGLKDPSHATPLIALTADATPEMEARALSSGMVACIHKPIDRVQVQQIIQTYGYPSVSEIGPDIPEDADVPQALPSLEAVLDIAALQRLNDLGGVEFCQDLAIQFMEECSVSYSQMLASIDHADQEALRRQAHALRSAAGNIGAQALYELLLSWRGFDSQDLHQHRQAMLDDLYHNMTVTRLSLSDHLGCELVCEIETPDLGDHPEMQAAS